MELIITLFIGITAGLSTFLASHKLHWGAVKSSAALSLSVAILIDYIPFQLVDIPSVFFGGSFVGMCGNKLFNEKKIVLASALYSVIYFFTYKHFNSIGGSLGSAACISCVFIFGTNKILSKRS